MKKVGYILLLLGWVVPMWALDVVFRYDDYRLIDDSLQTRMIEVFAEEQVPLHIAVIPFNADTTPILEEGKIERVRELAREGILQIALHGFCHKGETFQGEFLGLNEDEQRYRLEKGSALLDSIFGEHIHIFIPPWNRYNQTTLDILAELGYDMISSELQDNQLVTDERFQYYQEGCDHPTKLRKIVAKNAKREGLVVCMFHRYDFWEGYTMEDLRQLLKKLKANEDVRIVTMEELYQRDKSFNAERIMTNLHHPLLTKVLGTRPIILTIAEAKRLRNVDWMLHMAMLLIIVCAGACVAGWKNKGYWMVQAAVMVLAGMQVWMQWIAPKWGIAIMIAAVISIIIIAKWRVNSKKCKKMCKV